MLFSRDSRSIVMCFLNVAMVVTTVVSFNNWCVLSTLVVFLMQLNVKEYIYRGQGTDTERSELERLMWTCIAFLIWNVVAAQDVLLTLVTMYVVAMNLWVERLFCCPYSEWCI